MYQYHAVLQNLLLAMQKIQLNAGGDFAVVLTAPATYT
jgi:hypothetical protein